MFLMFVVVAIQAEIFPVTAIRRIIVMIMIDMMHGQLMQIGTREFPAAAAADPRMQTQRLFAVTGQPVFGAAPGIGNDLIKFLPIDLFAGLWSLLCHICLVYQLLTAKDPLRGAAHVVGQTSGRPHKIPV